MTNDRGRASLRHEQRAFLVTKRIRRNAHRRGHDWQA
jgi:hypothetical protein